MVYNIYVVQGACLFSEKTTFQMLFGQNCENTIAKKAKNKDKGGFLA